MWVSAPEQVGCLTVPGMVAEGFNLTCAHGKGRDVCFRGHGAIKTHAVSSSLVTVKKAKPNQTDNPSDTQSLGLCDQKKKIATQGLERPNTLFFA